MCDFQVGDQVVCIHPGPWKSRHRAVSDLWRIICNRNPIKGAVYTVTSVMAGEDGVGIDLAECPCPSGLAWNALLFRKVQRRDISQWLETATDFEEPTRAPKKERV